MTRSTERLGLTFAALCALNGAFVPAFAKLTTNAGDPVFVATATTLFGAVFATIVLWLRGDLHLLVRGRVALRLLLVGALGTAVAYILFFTGAQRSTAIETVICLQCEPAYSLLAAWIFLRHAPTPRRMLAIAVLLAGIVLAIGGHRFGVSSGVWLLLATPLCWQASHLIVLRRLNGVAPGSVDGRALHPRRRVARLVLGHDRHGAPSRRTAAGRAAAAPGDPGHDPQLRRDAAVVSGHRANRSGAYDRDRRAVGSAPLAGSELPPAGRSPDRFATGRTAAHGRRRLDLRDRAGRTPRHGETSRRRRRAHAGPRERRARFLSSTTLHNSLLAALLIVPRPRGAGRTRWSRGGHDGSHE